MLKGFFTARLHITTVWWWLLESNPHTHTQAVQTDQTKCFPLGEKMGRHHRGWKWEHGLPQT